MPKILWVIHGAEVYGESRAIYSLMDGVRRAGGQVEAISLTEGECFQKLKSDGFAIHCVQIEYNSGMHLANSRVGKAWQLLKVMLRQYPVRRRVLSEILARRPDAVHVLGKNILPAVGWAARKAGIPCFWEMTAVIGAGFWLDTNRRMYQRLLRRLRVLPLANSQYTAGTLGDTTVAVMHLGADARKFDPAHAPGISRASLGIPTGATVFVLISRIDKSKGQKEFVDAINRIQDPGLHVILVGDATLESDKPHLDAIKASLTPGQAERIHFVGFSGAPQDYLAISDIAVNARIDAEPFGLSVVEAMMMGKPVLVHALGGPAETVVDGETGWHVREATVEGYVAGIQRALGERPRWEAMGAAGRQRALTRFSLETQTQRYLSLLEEQMARRARKN